MGTMERIEDLKERYHGEWLAIKVTRREDSQPVEGELVYHSRDRQELLQKLELGRHESVYITYAGPLIEEGYAVAFHAI
jgi:hypothetical protein